MLYEQELQQNVKSNLEKMSEIEKSKKQTILTSYDNKQIKYEKEKFSAWRDQQK